MSNLTLVPSDPNGDVVVASNLLGELTVRPNDILTFPGGLLGFPECRRFALLRGERGAVYWLQSMEYPTLTFLLVDPFVIDTSYAFDVQPWQIAELGGTQVSDIGLLAVVTLPATRDAHPTANLQAPLVINFRTRRAKQLVTADEQFGVRYPVDLTGLVA